MTDFGHNAKKFQNKIDLKLLVAVIIIAVIYRVSQSFILYICKIQKIRPYLLYN